MSRAEQVTGALFAIITCLDFGVNRRCGLGRRGTQGIRILYPITDSPSPAASRFEISFMMPPLSFRISPASR